MATVIRPDLDNQFNTLHVKLFLAGGISGCPDWQTEAIECLGHIDRLDIINPRRRDFDVGNPTMSIEQIKWEHHMLKVSDVIMFWFPCETVCPITLFELGKYSVNTRKLLTVGTHPDYSRRLDVVEQLGLERPTKVYDQLEYVLSETRLIVNHLLANGDHMRKVQVEKKRTAAQKNKRKNK